MRRRRDSASTEMCSRLVSYVMSQTSLDQRSLAAALGLSPAFVSRVRHGERCFTLDHLRRIETLLGQPIGELLSLALPGKRSRDPRIAELQTRAAEMLETANRIRRMAIHPRTRKAAG